MVFPDLYAHIDGKIVVWILNISFCINDRDCGITHSQDASSFQ